MNTPVPVLAVLLALSGAALLVLLGLSLRRDRARRTAAADLGPDTAEIPAVPAWIEQACALTRPVGPDGPGRPMTPQQAAEWAWLTRALAARTGDDRG